ncbi:MAG: hypothetical protein Q7S00_06615, partial [bacterium]|nr:hypothetical protein [bacterium]
MKKDFVALLLSLTIVVVASDALAKQASKIAPPQPERKKETLDLGCIKSNKKTFVSSQWRYVGEKKWRPAVTQEAEDSCSGKKVVAYSCNAKKLVKQIFPCSKECQAGKCVAPLKVGPVVKQPGSKDITKSKNVLAELDINSLIGNRRSEIITMPGWNRNTVLGALTKHLNGLGNKTDLLININMSDSTTPPPGMTSTHFSGSRNMGFYMSGGNDDYQRALANAFNRMDRRARGGFSVTEETGFQDGKGDTIVVLYGKTSGGSQMFSMGGSNENFPPDSSAGTSTGSGEAGSNGGNSSGSGPMQGGNSVTLGPGESFYDPES